MKGTEKDSLKNLPPLPHTRTSDIIRQMKNQSSYYKYNRCLKFTTDSCDTSVRIYPKHFTDNFLEPDKSIQITVSIEPQERANINRRRHVFITCKHPDITFTIPIIILTKDDSIISIPSSIAFPTTVVENFTFYEMILYNKSLVKQSFNMKSANQNLTLHVKSFKIPKLDYVKVLLQLNCHDTEVVNDVIKLKLNLGDSLEIPFTHKPMAWSLFVDTFYIKFEMLRFSREVTKEFRICNESNSDIIFHVNFNTADEKVLEESHVKIQQETLTDNASITETNESKFKEIKFQDKFAFRHFKFKPECSTIKANSSFNVKVSFRPTMHKDFKPTDNTRLLEPRLDNEIPPFVISPSLLVTSKDKWKTEERRIFLKGLINGPDIEVIPKTIDMRQVYFGEEHCFKIQAKNIDEICDAHVDFYDLISHETAHIAAEPKTGLNLKPFQSGAFHLQFHAKVEGKFLVKLEFKVKYGAIYSVMIKGYSQHVRVKCFPDILDLGILPIAIPQKRLVLLMNPLAVPLSVSCTIMDDGYETPLVLNTTNVNENLPINVNEPDYEEVENGGNEFEFKYPLAEHETSMLSFRSADKENSTYSTEFEEQALDRIPDISNNLITHLKCIRIFDKPEMEKTTVEEALKAILNVPYFFNMVKYKNYTQLDWNSLATDPKEIYCNNETIILKPNTGKAITIVVIPNTLGYQHKYIALRVCPLMALSEDVKCPDLREFVHSDNMISKLWIKYNCSVPEIIWDNVIIMQDKLYAGEWYNFEMLFENHSKIGGFFYYDMVPNSNIGCMKFPDKQWKYFIEPGSKIKVKCAVKFNKLGDIVLAGLIKFVGVTAGYPFHIKSEVLPPKVNFSPSSIVETVEVLENRKLYVFIENATPSTTWFKLKLHNESNVSVEPCGGQLAPTGQAMYSTLGIFYNDPGIYKNVLYIILQYETIETIPITIHVKGMPIFFEPEICLNNLDIGCVVCNTEDEFLQNLTNPLKTTKVINKGLRNYRMVITRTKISAKPTCAINPVKAKIIVKPNSFIVPPLSEAYFTILTNCCEETSIFNEFRIDITDVRDSKLIQSQCFILTASFVHPQLTWNRRNITMNYYRTHKYKEQAQWESIQLTNDTVNFIDLISLKMTGPFKIKELFEHQFVKELKFSMHGLETKELYIILDKDMIRNHLNTFYEGRLMCYANSRQQKSVNLYIKMFIPELTIRQNNVVLFTKNSENVTFVELTNSGVIPSNYKWKKMQEEWRYISQEDDSLQLAEIIVSDIISSLDLDLILSEDEMESNMTLRFQKFRCVLNNLSDPIGVKEIIYEIIEHLDLMGRRYKLAYEEPPPAEGSMISTRSERNFEGLKNFLFEKIDDTGDHLTSRSLNGDRIFLTNPSSNITEELSSSDSCVNHTVDHVLDHLKLENSYIISEPSTDNCDQINSVYFIKKCGIVQEKETEECVLHIPPIKRGFEVRATFQLDVIGGKSQQFHIVLVNLDKTLKLSKDNIYLGLKPWYEKYETRFFAENITNYQIVLKIKDISRPNENMTKLATGYLKILNEQIIQIPALQNTSIKTEGILGFSEEFKCEFRIVINDGEVVKVQLHGHGVIPMLMLANNKLPFQNQDQSEIIEEYRLLQKLYYFEIFKEITEKDEMPIEFINEEENMSLMSDITLFSNSDSVTDSETTLTSEQAKKENVLQSYIVVNNNEDLPNTTLLNQSLETEIFLNLLRFNPETKSLLKKIYQNYTCSLKSFDAKMPINLKYFTIQPLPFQLRTHIMEMGKLYMNQYRKFVLTLEFVGPGKLIASARTAIKIPGLMIDFEIMEKTMQKDYIFDRSDNKLLTFNNKRYRNMNERQVDDDTDPKMKHAHSYDVNCNLEHQRGGTIKGRKWLMHHYDSLNKSVYTEQKYHLTHCKLFRNCKNNCFGTKLNVIVLFRPKKDNYMHNQQIEDYLYIDLHMGPVLPILLRGTVVDTDR